jgi:putative SOS response-associated peptidase YedK
MCSAVEFQQQALYFKDQTRLPVLQRDGSVRWVTWGKPYARERSGSPQGACARHESLLAGKWQRWQPVPVKIPCQAFMERDPARAAHWFALQDGQLIQGALVHDADPGGGDAILRVYVVTVAASGAPAEVHARMPRILSSGD